MSAAALIGRTLGSSGVPVTSLGLGTAPLGNLFTAVSEESADGAVRAAWDVGVRYFDTAPHYGLGLAEHRLGAALAERDRDEFVLQTKVGRLLRPAAAGGPERDDAQSYDVPADLERVWDFSADGVRRSIEESLTRLGLDRVDVALVHDPDEHEDQARSGALPALQRLRDEGVVRAIGVGMNQAAMPSRFVEQFGLDVVLLAGRYNLVEQTALDDLLPAAETCGTSIVLGGVFGSGLLAADWPADDAMYSYQRVQPGILARARRLAEVAREFGVTLPAVALQSVLAHPVVASAVIGMRSPAEVRRNAELMRVRIPVELWQQCRERGLVRPDMPLPDSGAEK